MGKSDVCGVKIGKYKETLSNCNEIVSNCKETTVNCKEIPESANNSWRTAKKPKIGMKNIAYTQEFQ